jgi:hypothetical protein
MRALPRISVEKLAHERVGKKDELGLVVDLSPGGLRIEKPSLGRRASPIVQLEFVLPEVDEIAWACGEVCFDQILPNMMRSTGIKIVWAASRHLRMLRDWVMAAADTRERFYENPLMYASHFR